MTCQGDFTLTNSLHLLFWFAICHLLFLSFSPLLLCVLFPKYLSPKVVFVKIPPFRPCIYRTIVLLLRLIL